MNKSYTYLKLHQRFTISKLEHVKGLGKLFAIKISFQIFFQVLFTRSLK